jgi:hypothetical protein
MASGERAGFGRAMFRSVPGCVRLLPYST